jgi:hypothetical protein
MCVDRGSFGGQVTSTDNAAGITHVSCVDRGSFGGQVTSTDNAAGAPRSARAGVRRAAGAVAATLVRPDPSTMGRPHSVQSLWGNYLSSGKVPLGQKSAPAPRRRSRMHGSGTPIRHARFGRTGVGRREIFGFSCTSTLARPRGPRARQAGGWRGVVILTPRAGDSGPRARPPQAHSAPTVRTDSVFGVGAARPNRNGNPRRSRPQAAPGAPLSRTGDSFSSFCILAGALDRLA